MARFDRVIWRRLDCRSVSAHPTTCSDPPAARVTAHMCSKSEPFSATKVRRTIRSFTIHRRAAAAGFTPAQVDKLGGHSLRAGFVTEAFRQGADAPRDHAADRASLPGDARGLRPREHAPLVGNAVTRLGL